MQFAPASPAKAGAITALFQDSFAASEGAEEGRLIATLVRELLNTTPADELRVFTAEDGHELAGCILFTRLHYEGDARRVYLLSPVAVAPGRQRQGIGQALLKHGLETLRAEGADVAVTYGDPAYYSKSGFQQVTADQVAPPCPLQYPMGWQAQSLTGADLAPLKAPVRCAKPFEDPALW